MKKKIEVTCPTCKTKFEYFSSEFRPFCSERCRLIDLGQWLTESYSMPAQKITEEEAETIENLINEENNYQDESEGYTKH